MIDNHKNIADLKTETVSLSIHAGMQGGETIKSELEI